MALFPLAPIWSLKIGSRAPFGSTKNIDRSDKVIHVRVKAVWLIHGAVAAPFSIVTGLLSANPITHWWVELKTKKGSWYCAQFDKPKLTLTKCRTQNDVTEHGKRAGGRAGEDVNITVKEDCSLGDGYFTIGDVAEWMKKFGTTGEYDFILNNCQDFGKHFYKWITSIIFKDYCCFTTTEYRS